MRLLDLTAAFGVFANGGLSVEPTPILRVERADGTVLRIGDAALEVTAWTEDGEIMGVRHREFNVEIGRAVV